MHEFLQLRISLDESDPQIWRRVILHKDTTFFELHHIIQISMGWQNYHVFEFSLEGYRIGMIDEEARLEGYGDDSLLDCSVTKLGDIISGVEEVLSYVYDLGDNWEHSIKIEGFQDADPNHIYPRCISGEMACPPEDCGGLYVFYHNLEVLKDKKHPEYRDTKMWMPRGYDPQKFNIEKVNKQLGKLDAYIMKWLRG